MPLEHGHSKELIQKNIDEMIRSGHDPKQAVAAAYAQSRKAKKMGEGGEIEPEEIIPTEEIPEIGNETDLLAKALKEKFEDEE